TPDTETTATITLLPVGFDIVDIEYDNVEGKLYALLFSLGSGMKQLATIATTGSVGAVTTVGSAFAHASFTGTPELDETQNRSYFCAGSNVNGIDTTTGSVPAGASGPISPLVQGLEPDRTSGVVYGLQIDGSDRRVVEISTSAGTYGNVVNPGADINGGNPL